jgi:hypothetical protein
MAAPHFQGSLSILDYERDTSTVSFLPFGLGVGGILDFPTASTNGDEIKDALDFFTIGTITQTRITAVYPESSIVPPTDKAANNASKFLFTLEDTVEYLGALNTAPNPKFGSKFKLEVPCADDSLMTNNSKILNLTDAGIAAQVAILEANLRSPWNFATVNGDGAAVRVLEIRRVGRNV